jgi:hypothetical protein
VAAPPATADVDVDRVPLGGPVDVVLAGAPDRPDRARDRVLEDEHVARDAALGRCLPDDRRGVEAGLRPGVLVVVDHDRDRVLGRRLGADRQAGQGRGHEDRRRPRGRTRGGGRGGAWVGVGRRRRRRKRRPVAEATEPGRRRRRAARRPRRPDGERGRRRPRRHGGTCVSGPRRRVHVTWSPSRRDRRRSGAQNSRAIPRCAPAADAPGGGGTGRDETSRYERCLHGSPQSDGSDTRQTNGTAPAGPVAGGQPASRPWSRSRPRP